MAKPEPIYTEELLRDVKAAMMAAAEQVAAAHGLKIEKTTSIYGDSLEWKVSFVKPSKYGATVTEEALWHRQAQSVFGLDPNLLGKTIQLLGHPNRKFVVAGIRGGRAAKCIALVEVGGNKVYAEPDWVKKAKVL